VKKIDPKDFMAEKKKQCGLMCKAKDKYKDRDITKLKIFAAIYDTHIDEYRKKWQEIKEKGIHPEHYQIIYYPVDLGKVAENIKTTPDIIHQVLYYYDDLYTQEKKHLFTGIQNTGWCINFPLMCVLLGEAQEKYDYEQSIRNSTKVSAIASLLAVIISVVALIISCFK
jgi:hypothetical protein